ncbi:MAG: sulfatase [Opitutaceae bacterium]|nr:sulfatase [Opitutaceae bacterium]
MNLPVCPAAVRSLRAFVPVLAVALALAASARAATPRKPNFVLIYTDDQRYDALGVVQREQGNKGRFPWFKTPHIDRIAAEGVRFRNAFVVLSLCAPSRAVFLTGRYNHLNGIANNATPFPENSVTHATLLKSAGYTTASVGKWHMDGQSGQRPGFDYSASFIGQGQYFDCPIEINGKPTPSTGWVDDVTTDYAIDFMRRHRDAPFSLVLGFKACHLPRQPPERAKDRFAGAKARPVPNIGTRAIYGDGESAARKAKGKSPAVNDGTSVDLNYFRCISAVDDNVGRVLAALDELKLTDDTFIVFTSDNGFYLGEHGLDNKRSAYDESLRIPLVIRYPRMIAQGSLRDEMVLNLDFAPTLVDLAGVSVPRGMQGQSWRSLLAGKPANWRQSFLMEYFWENSHPDTPTLVGVRTTTAKLITYPGHAEWTELFDLANDPFETRNLANDTRNRELLAKMKAEFGRQVKATGFVIPEYAHKPGDPLPPKQPKAKARKANAR